MAKYGLPISKSVAKDNQSSVQKVADLNIKINPATLKVPQKDLLIFFRQLSVILQSGVPLAQGISLLSENTKDKKFAILQYRISNRLVSGEELSICLKQFPKVFAPIVIGLIEAGETGGILDKVLERIANLMEDREKIKSQITGALIYPVLILFLATTISLALLIIVVPKFDKMFSDLGADLPGLTKFMLTLSQFVTSSTFFILAPISIFFIITLFTKYYQTRVGKFNVDRFVLAIPLFGPLILRSEVASMCDTLATLVNSGIPLVEGLDRCMAASGSEPIKRTINTSKERVIQGEELSSSLGLSNVLPKLVVSMIKIGEETGQLSFLLENLAKFYKRELEMAVTSLTKAMEPLVIVVVAAIVGTIVVALYLPMFSIIGAMG